MCFLRRIFRVPFLCVAVDVFGLILTGRLSCLRYMSWGSSTFIVILSSVVWIWMLSFWIPGRCAIMIMSVPSCVMSINGSSVL